MTFDTNIVDRLTQLTEQEAARVLGETSFWLFKTTIMHLLTRTAEEMEKQKGELEMLRKLAAGRRGKKCVIRSLCA